MNCVNKLILRWEEKIEKVIPQERKIKHKGKEQSSPIQKTKKMNLPKEVDPQNKESVEIQIQVGEKNSASDPKVEIQDREIAQEAGSRNLT